MTAWRTSAAQIALLLVPAAAVCEDFRVETDVFAESAQQPVTETLTLFFGDVVYDFVLTEPRETTVFDVARGRILLLDSEKKIKAKVTTDELLTFTAGIRARTQDANAQQLFGSEFAGEFDTTAREAVVQGKNLSYRAQGVAPKYAVAAERYRSFADWYARLNAVRLGNPPPFGRIELNRQLFEHRLIPDEIVRTLVLPGRLRDERRTVTSRHAFTWMLSTTDRKRIEDAGTAMATYEHVTLNKYMGVEDVAQREDPRPPRR